MIKSSRHVAAFAAIGLMLGACTSEDNSINTNSPNNSIQAAEQTRAETRDLELHDWSAPIDGLTPTQLARFEQGKAMFEKVFTPSNGLGAVFNAQSCVECHGQPAVGGTDPAKPFSVSPHCWHRILPWGW